MRTFGQYIETMFNEADEPPGGAMPPGGPPPSGGAPPMGGGAPPMGGGGMPPMGGGAPPMGGGAPPTETKPAQKVKTHNVWTELEKLFHNK